MQTAQQLVLFNVRLAWLGVAAGVLSGAVIGNWFLKDDWLGGYGSHRRRLLRLAHVSFFGLAFINFLFGLTVFMTGFAVAPGRIVSLCLLAATVTMPICCVLCAWRKSLHYLFPVPVGSLFVAIAALLSNWPRS
ncbi:MAG: hypothetical protein ACJ8M1_03200 [Chthoniobacterales bacterium]